MRAWVRHPATLSNRPALDIEARTGQVDLVRPDVLPACAWSAIVLGAAWHYGTYTTSSIVLVGVGTVALGAGVLARGRDLMGPSRTAMLVGAVTVLAAVERSPGVYAAGNLATVSASLGTLAAIILALCLVMRPVPEQAVAYGVVVLAAAAGATLILASPSPHIDVWTMLQAAGHGLSQNHNIYTLRWTTSIPFEQSNGFAYLPGSAVVLWPFEVVLGDVRYGLLAATVLTAFLLVRVGRHSAGSLVAALAIVYPRATFGIEQSWVDPLLLFTLCASVYAVTHRRYAWAVVALALCLACKQQAWILLPLAACWKEFGLRRAFYASGAALSFIVPWAAAAPRAFYHGAIAYNLNGRPRLDSLSLYRIAVAHGFAPGVGATAAVTILAVIVTCRRMPQSPPGFLLGAAFVMATFNFVNKQSFFNEWVLAGGLALAALVFASAEHLESPRERDDRRDRMSAPTRAPRSDAPVFAEPFGP